MPKLSSFKEALHTVKVQVEGQEITISFVLGSMGPDLADWLKKSGTGSASLREMIAKVVRSWDITDDDGTTIPITVEAMTEYGIPTPVLNAMIAAMYADVEPDELKKWRSGAGSLRNGATAH